MYGGMSHKLSMLRKKSTADVTPDAVNWNNPTGPNGTTTNIQTISGITIPITLSIDIAANDGLDLDYKINNGSWINITSGGAGNNLASFTVSNNDTLQFKISNGSFTGQEIDVYVYNISDNSTLLDQFLITYQSSGGGV